MGKPTTPLYVIPPRDDPRGESPTRKGNSSPELTNKVANQIKDQIEEKFTTLTNAFRNIDKDSSGKITNAELTNAMRKFDVVAGGQDVIDDLVAAADIDGDGQIGYTEFARSLAHSKLDDNIFRTDEAISSKIYNSGKTIMNDGLDPSLIGQGSRVGHLQSQSDRVEAARQQHLEAQAARGELKPTPPLTPRETSGGLSSPAPRPTPEAFASLKGAATPRPQLSARPSPQQKGGLTSIILPSMLTAASDPAVMNSERSLTPRAPPNEQVRPPPRPKFLNPNRLIVSDAMRGHIDSVVFAETAGPSAAAAAAAPPAKELSEEATPHGFNSHPDRGHPTNQSKEAPGGKGAAAAKELPQSQKKFAWSSERIAHELVCKFDQFTRRREDHMRKLMWTVGTDPEFEAAVQGTSSNCCVTPENFGRICSRFGLICNNQISSEIFERHDLPTDGTCNIYTLAKNFLDTPHDTAQLSRDSQKAIFGTPPKRPVTPRRKVDAWRLARLPQSSWDEHSQASRGALPPIGASPAGMPAAGRANPTRGPTALW